MCASKTPLSSSVNDLFYRPTTRTQKTLYHHIEAPSIGYLQADLLDCSGLFPYQNRQTRFLFVGVDVYSRYAFAIPLTHKTAVQCTKAFHDIESKYEASDHKISTFTADGGPEFSSIVKELRKRDIPTYVSEPGEKNNTAVVERYNRTLRANIGKFMVLNSTKQWVDHLQELVDQYNQSRHSTTQLEPALLWKPVPGFKERPMMFYPKEAPQTYFSDIQPGDTVRIMEKQQNQIGRRKAHENFWSPSVYEVRKLDGFKIYLAGKDKPYMRFQLLPVQDTTDYSFIPQERKNEKKRSRQAMLLSQLQKELS